MAVPGEVISVSDNRATVDFGGARRDVCIDLLKSVEVGDFVLVHVGYAIQLIDREEAEKMLEAWREVSKSSRRELSLSSGREKEIVDVELGEESDE